MWAEFRRWRGVLLIGVISVGTIWLGATGQLVLYIHPRYVVFTITMAVIALGFVIARVAISGRKHVDSDHAHDHNHDDDDRERPLQRALSLGALLVAVVIAVAAVVLPPATLSAATATQRDVTSSQADLQAASLADAAAADGPTFSRYTVVEWSSILAQTSDPVFYAGKPVDVIGFVTPDPVADDVFFVTRFTITCCAVDAQPIGVPVYMPGWSSTFQPGDWVEVTGEFASNRSSASPAPLAVAPSGVISVDEPSEPYLY